MKQKNMKVLLLSWNFPPVTGGIEYVSKNLFYGLKGLNINVKLVTQNGKKEDDKNIFRSPYNGVVGYLAFCLIRGYCLIKNWDCDLIVCGSVVSAPVACILSTITRKPYTVLIHGSDLLFHNKVYHFLIKTLMLRADVLCANSLNTKNLLVNYVGKPKRIVVIHPGVNCEKFREGEKQKSKVFLPEYNGRKIIVTIGRLIRRKGVLQFIENVMPKLVEKFPNILYLVVGEDAEQSLVHKERLKNIIQNRIENLGLQKNVKLLGKISDSDLVRLLFRSDLFVLPCIEVPGDIEGFGIVFLEAALSGTPSVASRLGGIPDAVIDKKTGILVEPSDYSGYVYAITKLLEDNHYREELSKEGKKRVYEKFCWGLILKKYNDLFISIANQKARK